MQVQYEPSKAPGAPRMLGPVRYRQHLSPTAGESAAHPCRLAATLLLSLPLPCGAASRLQRLLGCSPCLWSLESVEPRMHLGCIKPKALYHFHLAGLQQPPTLLTRPSMRAGRLMRCGDEGGMAYSTYKLFLCHITSTFEVSRRGGEGSSR